MIPKIDYVIIENVTPELDGGIYHVKRKIGDLFRVEADIFSHGHEIIKARLMYRKRGGKTWDEADMVLINNDRWYGVFLLEENAYYEYTVFAWRDAFLSWVQDTFKKYIDGQDITSDLIEGKCLIEKQITKAKGIDKDRLKQAINLIDKILNGEPNDEVLTNMIFGEDLSLLMEDYADRSICGWYNKILTVFVNRKKAEFSSWYEMWPRSQGTVEGKSATFKDMENRLKEISSMGFDVIYLPPIHPIGETNRKGPNNFVIAASESPGCPYAIGNKYGGHTAIEASLGTIDDFCNFQKACNKTGIELALDFAIQVSPDHPWVKKHPEWFRHRPDGSIKYAENPPKKYEDIYPINFDTEDKDGLWNELLNIIKFWMDKGVRIFRVDNPHTKPFLFWKWLISEIHKIDPGVIFLSEAFTRPKVMKSLAKMGFNQSYTYFTWRNYKQELIDYFTELTQTNVADYMIGNLFTNTPDILPEFLQNAPRSAFKIRATLAATLSSVWGMYNGFELCEGKPIPGKEEYIDSEKYQFKVWDWDRPGNIKEYITKLNMIRRNNTEFQHYRNLIFFHAENNNILFYCKYTKDFENAVLVVVNLDPYNVQESIVYVPVHMFGFGYDETYEVIDLITGEHYFWCGERNYIKLDPINKEPAHILKIIKHHQIPNAINYNDGTIINKPTEWV